MDRLRVVLVVAVAAGTAFVSGAADEKKPGEKNVTLAKPVPATGHKIAVFNMAAVMRDFNQAKYQVYLLDKKKKEMSVKLVEYRSEYIKLQGELKPQPSHPNKDEYLAKMRDLAHKIEDEDTKISKRLNDDANVVIADLYDKMSAVVEKTAQLNDFRIVFAYPDAVTPEETNSAYIKELKLKPPAAQPFYVDPRVDITAVVIRTLNAWYPPIGPDGKPVDVSKLDLPPDRPTPKPDPQLEFPKFVEK